MTLVAAVALEDGRVWMGAERYAGHDPYVTLAGPKVFELVTPDHVPFLVGFAGSPRVAQVILAATPPRRERASYSLHWWLTEWAETVRQRAIDCSVLVDGGAEGAYLTDQTHMLVAVDGAVVKFGCDLSWEEPARGWESIGCAVETFHGAYEALRQSQDDRVDAAKLAFRVCRRFHHIGDLADALILPAMEGA